jgi:outer membrane protein TolC
LHNLNDLSRSSNKRLNRVGLMLFKSFLFIVTISFQVCAHALILTEEDLIRRASLSSPSLDQIESNYMASEISLRQINEKYAPELFARGSYAETNERPIITFMPVWSPLKQAQVGIKKDLTKGITAEMGFVADQRSALTQLSGSLDNITTTSLMVKLQMDLWKDLLGKMSEAQLNLAQFSTKKAKLEKTIQQKTFTLTIRRLFWALVANQESLKVSGELLKSAQLQAKETQGRVKNAIAESDELARYDAQVASRTSSLLYLQYQRETIFKQLKSLLPEISSDSLDLAPYDLDKTYQEVMACAAVIGSQKEVPKDFTLIDEVIETIREMRAHTAGINSRYSKADLKFFAQVKSTGVGSDKINNTFTRGSYQAAINDAQGNNRLGYEVGLNYSLALGDAKKNTQSSKEIYDDKKLSALMTSSLLQLTTSQQDINRSVVLLNQAIKAQAISTLELQKRLKAVMRKYEQARVGITEIINDQDALLNSELSSIQARLQLINIFLDYFTIYTETPCPFNRN